MTDSDFNQNQPGEANEEPHTTDKFSLAKKFSDKEIQQLEEQAANMELNDLQKETLVYDKEYQEYLSDPNHVLVDFTPRKREREPLTKFVDELHQYTGWDRDELYLMVLMNISRNIGSMVGYEQQDNINISPNLYALLVAPPGEFNKSTLIDTEDRWTKIIDSRSGLNELRFLPQMTYLGLSRFASQFKGSEEKIADIMANFNITHFRAKEFGQALDIKHLKAYAHGLLDLLQEVYYRNQYEYLFRQQPTTIPHGRYVTLFGDLHPEEITAEVLALGTIRRCVIVKKDYKDIDLNDTSAGASFDEISKLKFNKLQNIYIEMMKGYVIRLFAGGLTKEPPTKKETAELEKKLKPKKQKQKDIDDYTKDEEIPRLLWKYRPNTYKITLDSEALNTLQKIYLDARIRVKNEESPRRPTENNELIAKISVNIMLFENVYYNTIDNFTVTTNHIEQAISFLKRNEANYIEEISKLEDVRLETKVKKLVSLVETSWKEGNKPVSHSEILHITQWRTRDAKDVEQEALDRGLICGVKFYKTKTNKLLFTPNDQEIKNRVIVNTESEVQNPDSDITGFKFISDVREK